MDCVAIHMHRIAGGEGDMLVANNASGYNFGALQPRIHEPSLFVKAGDTRLQAGTSPRPSLMAA